MQYIINDLIFIILILEIVKWKLSLKSRIKEIEEWGRIPVVYAHYYDGVMVVRYQTKRHRMPLPNHKVQTSDEDLESEILVFRKSQHMTCQTNTCLHDGTLCVYYGSVSSDYDFFRHLNIATTPCTLKVFSAISTPRRLC